MASKTRIVILHMKEILFTLVFLAIALILIFIFVYMFSIRGTSDDPGHQNNTYASDIPQEDLHPITNTSAGT